MNTTQFLFVFAFLVFFIFVTYKVTKKTKVITPKESYGEFIPEDKENPERPNEDVGQPEKVEG